MNITKQKHTHRDREQTSSFQRREGWEEGQNRQRDEKVQNTSHKISKSQECNVQHKEYSHYFIISLYVCNLYIHESVQFIKILNHCVVYLKLIL